MTGTLGDEAEQRGRRAGSGWAALPPVFALAVVLAAAGELARVYLARCGGDAPLARLVIIGMLVMLYVLLGFGAFALARRVPARARQVVRASGAVRLVMAVLVVGAVVAPAGGLAAYLPWLGFAASALLVIGMAMALEAPRRTELWLCIALALALRPPPPSSDVLWECLRAFLPPPLVVACEVLFVVAYWVCIAALAAAAVVPLRSLLIARLPPARVVPHD